MCPPPPRGFGAMLHRLTVLVVGTGHAGTADQWSPSAGVSDDCLTLRLGRVRHRGGLIHLVQYGASARTPARSVCAPRNDVGLRIGADNRRPRAFAQAEHAAELLARR